MARTRFYRSWSNQTVERLPNIQNYVAYEPDPKLRIARAMWRETNPYKTYREIAEAIGMTEMKCRTYLREHGMVRGDRRFGPKGKPPAKQEKEEMAKKEKDLTRKEVTSPNGMKISYPAWHDEAREMRKTMTMAKVAEHFGVSVGRISQIVSPMWMAHTLREGGKYVGRPIAELARELGFTITDKKTKKEPPKPVAEIVKPAQITKTEEAPVAHHRVFEKHFINDPSDRRNAVKIACSSCSNKAFFAKHGVIAHDHARKNFLAKGWLIGSGPGADKCPECLVKIKSGREAAKDPKSMAEALFKKPLATEAALKGGTMLQSPGVGLTIDPTPTPPSAPVMEKPVTIQPKPVAPGPDLSTRRLILMKLNEVYSEAGNGYNTGWTDAKVATDLGTMVEWVAKLREENFGPEDDPSMAKRKQEIAGVVADIAMLRKEVEAVASALKVLTDSVQNQAAKGIKNLGSLEALEARINALK